MENKPAELKEQPLMLTVSQAAEQSGVSESAIYNAIDRKRLPAQKLYGRLVLIEKAELEKYLANKPNGRPKGSTNRKKDGEAEA